VPLAGLAQIAMIDIVFSLDSVITAVGLADHLTVMVLAILISVAVMMVAARPLGEFVDRHPTVKMLALSFLVLVGVTLIAGGSRRTCQRALSTSRWPSRWQWRR
jgi:predicted tellurium resistance membrane protein TerC